MKKSILIIAILASLSSGCAMSDSMMNAIAGNHNNTKIDTNKSQNLHVNLANTDTLSAVHKVDKKATNNRYKIRALSGKLVSAETYQNAIAKATVDNVLFKLQYNPQAIMMLNARIALTYCQNKTDDNCLKLQGKRDNVVNFIVAKYKRRVSMEQVLNILNTPIKGVSHE